MQLGTWLKRMLSLSGRTPSAARIAPFRPAMTLRGIGLSEDEDRIEQAFMGLVLGVHSPLNLPINSFERAAIKSFEVALHGNLADSRLVPRLPSVLPRIMSCFRDPDTTIKDLTDLIASDLVSVSEIIRLANSPFYRRASDVKSLEQAVLVLGQKGLRQLMANLLVRPIFNQSKGHFSGIAGTLLWNLSEHTAVVNAAFARTRGEDEFVAYLSGLTSHVGLLVGCRVLDQQFDGAQIPNSLLFRAQWRQLGRRMSAAMVRVWAFPDQTCLTLEGLIQPGLSSLGVASAQLYRAEKISQCHYLQRSGRWPLGSSRIPDLFASDEHLFALGMQTLSRYDGEADSSP